MHSYLNADDKAGISLLEEISETEKYASCFNAGLVLISLLEKIALD